MFRTRRIERVAGLAASWHAGLPDSLHRGLGASRADCMARPRKHEMTITDLVPDAA
jgi:hypothetical protein